MELAMGSTWNSIGMELYAVVHSIFLSQESRQYWPYLICYVGIGVIMYLLGRRAISNGQHTSKKNVWQFLFPREIYLHKSSMLDLKLWLFNIFLARIGVIIFVLAAVYKLSSVIVGWLSSFPVFPTSGEEISVLDRIVFTIVTVALFDFAAFTMHYLQHKVRFLWEFHKIHHSAEVLTPATVHRFHPVETIVSLSAVVLIQSVAVGMFTAIKGTSVDPITVLNVSFIQFFFFLTANIRHSHLWIGFGPTLSQLFVSPCMHQIHHSSEKKHTDKNFGFIFSCWDKFAGTIYIPVRQEQLNFGLSGNKTDNFETLTQLLFSPFLNIARRIKLKNFTR